MAMVQLIDKLLLLCIKIVPQCESTPLLQDIENDAQDSGLMHKSLHFEPPLGGMLTSATRTTD